MTNETQDKEAAGPLQFPTPTDVETRLALRRLTGHTTSAHWLPEGFWPELDELRDEQLRLREQVATQIAALQALDARFRGEDKEHAEALRQAHRDGSPGSVKDRRTPDAERSGLRAEIEERLSAGLQVFAEHADRVIEAVREHEDEWLADLRSRLAPAQEKKRQAEALLAEAAAEEFRLSRLGGWVQKTADDGAFGRQPAPVAERPPARFSPEVFRSGFERPWHKRKPWNRASGEAAA